ncbi:MAG: PAS domain S-box protein [Cyanobacteria bacterium J06648_16]
MTVISSNPVGAEVCPLQPAVLPALWNHISDAAWVIAVQTGTIGEIKDTFELVARNPAFSQLPAALAQQLTGAVADMTIGSRCDHPSYQQAVETGQATYQVRSDGEQFSVTVTATHADSTLQLVAVAQRSSGVSSSCDVILQQIIDSIPAAIVWKDRNSVFQGCNREFLKIAGCEDPADLVGKTDYDMPWTREESDWYRQCDLTVMAADEPELGIVEPQRQADGRRAWLRTSKIPLHDTGGQVNGILVVIEDITDRKITEEALQQSEQRFRHLFEATPKVAMQIYDRQRHVIGWNQASEALYGYTAEEALGRKLEDLIIPDALRSQVIDGIEAWITNGTAIPSGELTLQDKSGNPVEVFSSHVLFPNAEGELELYCLDLDVRDRNLAQRSLQEYANYQSLLNNLASQIRNSLDLETILETTLALLHQAFALDHCGFAWLNLEARAPRWELVKEAKSPERNSLLGVYRLEALGRQAAQALKQQTLVQIDDRARAEADLTQLMQSFGVRSQVWLPIKTRQGLMGSLICSHHSAHAWTHSEVDLLQAVADQVAIGIDQSQLYAQSRQQAEELIEIIKELKQAQTRVVQAEKMSSLGQLVAGVAHEINNPVSFIHGNLTPAQTYAEDLLMLIEQYQQAYPHPTPDIEQAAADIDLPFLKRDFPKLLGSMVMGTDRIREIVLSLRNFSRLDESDSKAVDIHEGLDSTLVILQNRLKGGDGTLPIEVIKDYSDLPLVKCYPGKLNQVFMNILANAIDALESSAVEQPVITLRTEQLNVGWVSIEIADNGPGIPETTRAQIFDPFFTTKPVGKGTGMGLSISYQIVTEEHAGQLICQTPPTGGTEFVIVIPLQ